MEMPEGVKKLVHYTLWTEIPLSKRLSEASILMMEMAEALEESIKVEFDISSHARDVLQKFKEWK